MQDLSRNSRRPAFNVPALAATILYAAMQPVDHWPVQLVQAYAEDSFGPRLWVDDEQCALLAQNLALVHTGASDSNGSDDEDDAQKLRDAASVAEAYRTFDASAVTTDFPESSSGTGTPGRRGSMDSHSSLDRSSGNSSRVRRQLSSGRSADSVDSRTKKNAKQGGDSDSGDEQMLVGTAASDLKRKHDDGDSSSGEEDEGSDGENMAKRGNGDGDSSSSGEEDEDVIMTNADSPTAQRAVQKAAKRALNFKDSNGSMSVDVAVQFYPVQQRRLNLTRVRRRYFGANLDSAKEAIASSLHSRLDLKTKQNSGLLQTLPSFTSVPGVRRLIAENLEKWLQSPALAGLARALFSKTVNDLENQDPPLNDDIKAINSILSMRLKANQVS
jgi:integrator complex subunit 1